MIEKRFTMSFGKYQDHLEGREYDEKWESWKICLLLNELHDENEELKQQLSSINQLIDKKIEEYLNIPSLSDGALTSLKELKKELEWCRNDC